MVIGDGSRYRQIVSDAIDAINEGRSPLVLTERTEHIQLLTENLRMHVQHIVILKGGMSAIGNREIGHTMQSISESETRVIVATGRCVGILHYQRALLLLLLGRAILQSGLVFCSG